MNSQWDLCIWKRIQDGKLDLMFLSIIISQQHIQIQIKNQIPNILIYSNNIKKQWDNTKNARIWNPVPRRKTR